MRLIGVLLKKMVDATARQFSINFERSWGSAILHDSKRHKCHTLLVGGKKEYLRYYRLCELLFNPQDDWPYKQKENNRV